MFFVCLDFACLSLSFSLIRLVLLQLAKIVNQGKLVSDEIIIDLLSKRLEAGETRGETGFILDGFPRTIRQAVSFHFDEWIQRWNMNL